MTNWLTGRYRRICAHSTLHTLLHTHNSFASPQLAPSHQLTLLPFVPSPPTKTETCLEILNKIVIFGTVAEYGSGWSRHIT
ncbi:unnamed protein product [Tenebrio molitor]|nr:unnamed protein product [Tenebrio molitor]